MLVEGDRKIKLILASASPRRKKILELLKLDFKVIKPQNYIEKQFNNPYIMVVENSIIKAKSVYNYLKKQNFKEHDPGHVNEFLVVAFDTIVYINRRYLGKPVDRKQAIEFLNILSGKVHKVLSGVCVLESVSGNYISDAESTRVKFRKLTLDEIKRYLDKENVLDKAGAYNIFGYGSLLVEKINGCFYNVAGIPVYKFLNLLKKFGFNIIG